MIKEVQVKIEGFVWFNEILEKLEQKHGVQQQEIREVFSGHPYFCFVEKGYRSGENVYAALGPTDAGRYLIVFFIYKKNKQAIILSARNMTDAEREKYEER